MKKSIAAIALILPLLLAAGCGTSSGGGNSVPQQISEPEISFLPPEYEHQTERINNCDGASPNYLVNYKTIETQNATFEVVVEAGGLVTGTPIPTALEIQLEAKIAASLSKQYGINVERNHELPLIIPTGKKVEHVITWKVTRIKGIIDVLYQQGTAQVAFSKIANIELYDRKSQELPCDESASLIATQAPVATEAPAVTSPQNALPVTDECYQSAPPFYATTFSSGSDSIWSSNRVTPVDNPHYGSILGPFGNERIALKLTGLNSTAAHSGLWISLDLHILLTWDGNTYRDFWGLDVDKRNTFLTTFDYWYSQDNPDHSQDFPSPYSGSQTGKFPPRTNAVSNNTLGFTFSGTNEVLDSTYRLCFKVPHSADSAEIVFYGSELENSNSKLEDESWGIDNVMIFPVP